MLEKALQTLALKPDDPEALKEVLALYRRRNINIDYVENIKNKIRLTSSAPVESIDRFNPIYLRFEPYEQPEFKVSLVASDKHYIEFHVVECVAWDTKTKEVLETIEYLHCYIKWDGGSDLDFGESDDTMAHFSGGYGWRKHIALMTWLWENMPKLIPHYCLKTGGILDIIY